MKRLFVATAFAASTFGVHPHEVDVSLIGYSFGPVERAVFNSQSFPAGKYEGIIDFEEFEAWCAEVTQTLKFNVDYKYDLVDATPSPMASALQAIGAFDLGGNVTNATESAAVQLDIWRVLDGQQPLHNYAQNSSVKVHYLRNQWHQDLVYFTEVQEPTTLALFGATLIGLSFLRKKS